MSANHVNGAWDRDGVLRAKSFSHEWIVPLLKLGYTVGPADPDAPLDEACPTCGRPRAFRSEAERALCEQAREAAGTPKGAA